MNVAIYLGDNLGDAVDISRITSGNPGVGGTQYQMLLLAHLLCENGVNVTTYAARDFVGGVHDHVVIRRNALVAECSKRGADILIIRDYSREIREQITARDLKVIYWCHNFEPKEFCDFAAHTPQVKAVVYVGKQHYDYYYDNDVISKSTYIFNIICDTVSVDRHNDSRTVVYMGSLIKSKGFHALCKIWKDIVAEVPEARLEVLGTGQLYGNSKVGVHGIADEKYEQLFWPYISDNKGELLPSVHFCGIMGDEKIDVFAHASVGVVNPTAQTETFCLGVGEMAVAELPVVTLARNGYLDTVVNGQTGLLCKSLNDIRSGIVKLLRDTELNERLGRNAKLYIRKFAPEHIVPQWLALLEQVADGSFKGGIHKLSAPNNCGKRLRAMMACLRLKLGLRFLPSNAGLKSTLTELKKRIIG